MKLTMEMGPESDTREAASGLDYVDQQLIAHISINQTEIVATYLFLNHDRFYCKDLLVTNEFALI